jgi:hypothetical protein
MSDQAVIANAAKQSSLNHKAGLLRRFAPSANASRLSQAMTEYVATGQANGAHRGRRSDALRQRHGLRGQGHD